MRSSLSNDQRGAPPRSAASLARLGVCADDYALTPEVSRAIRQLLAAGRISATSVMAASEYWPDEASAVRPFAERSDIGLHITLTDQKPLGRMAQFAPDGAFPPLTMVLKNGVLRRLPLAEIAAEIERQLAAFIEHFGGPPAHLDGHHHVHQLPGIREIVVGIAQRLRPAGTYVRSCHSPSAVLLGRGVAPAKALLISTLGRGLDRRLRAAGLTTNSGFSGVYDFSGEQRPLADVFARFLQGAGDRHLIMCHPGYSDAVLADKDVMTKAREAELEFLSSDAWLGLVADAGFEIGSLRETAAG